MAYVPRTPPADPARVPEYLAEELRRFADSVQGKQALAYVTKLNVEPLRPREGMVAYADGTNWNPGSGEGMYRHDGTQWVAIEGGGGGATVEIQTITTTGSQTWTKPANAKWVFAEVVGGGGGGGGGRRGAAGSVRQGGGGGGGGGYGSAWFLASDLGSTESVYVGEAGSAGAAAGADNTNGGNGGNGGYSAFPDAGGSFPQGAIRGYGGGGGMGGGDGSATINGGGGGGWGSAGSNGSGGGAGGAPTWNQIYGGGAGTTTVADKVSWHGGGGGGAVTTTPAAVAAGNSYFGAGGGGAGKSINAADSNVNGSAAGSPADANSTTGSGPSFAGQNGYATPDWLAGTGGAGGDVAGAGGAGASYGGGGGGGGASTNGTNSGAGGAGASGVVRVVTFISS